MFGFAFPGMGRSHTRDWTIEGGHLAERCQLFVIVALGETLLATGACSATSSIGAWKWFQRCWPPSLARLRCVVAASASRDATEAITHAEDPGRMGANFHYVHALLIAGIIATAVGNDLVMDHPAAAVTTVYATVMVAGPLIYLLGSAWPQARGLWTRAALTCWARRRCWCWAWCCPGCTCWPPDG